MPTQVIENKFKLAKARVMNNDLEINLNHLFELQKQGISFGDSELSRTLADILLHVDGEHIEKIESCINKALENDTKNAARWHIAKDYALYAKLYSKKGDNENAKLNLTKAIEIMKECGADGWVEIYEKGMAQL